MPRFRSGIEPGNAAKELVKRIDLGRTLRELRDIPQNITAEWSRENLALLERLFDDEIVLREYRQRCPTWMDEDPATTDDSHQAVQEQVHRLVRYLELLEADVTAAEDVPPPTTIEKAPTIFVVHGRDDGSKQAVVTFLQDCGLHPTVLNEQANRGRTILQKLEDYGDVRHAVVILAADDEGRLCRPGESYCARARQNVIYEMGYFAGRLLMKNTSVLVTGEVEIPSDVKGLGYITMDDAGKWKDGLANELRAAGLLPVAGN